MVRGEIVFDQAPIEATAKPSSDSPHIVIGEAGSAPAATAPSESGLIPAAPQLNAGTSESEESLEDIGEKIVNSPDSSIPIQSETSEVNSEEALLLEE